MKTSVLEQLPSELCHRYGTESLVAFKGDDTDERGIVDLKGFVERSYPSQVLDVVEFFFSQLPDENKLPFHKELIKCHLSDRIAQGSLGVLGNGVAVILDLDDRIGRVVDFKK